MRTVWFHREYTRLYGGHLKHAHYFGHVARLPGFTPRITYTGEPATAALARERSQLWPPGEAGAAARWTPGRDDVLFLAGVDWRYLAAQGLDALPNPRVNLIQGVRHAHDTELYGYLAHRAVRVCVSKEVADAIKSTGQVNGPVFAIPNAVDVRFQGPTRRGLGWRSGLKPWALARRHLQPPTTTIIGYKRPDLAQALSHRLNRAGVRHRLLLSFLPRHQFLATLVASSVAVCLPLSEEGFYLPALEAMATGCVTITLDCIGNRGFCHHQDNCLIAEPTAESLTTAVQEALNQSPGRRKAMLRQAKLAAERHSLAAERTQFHDLLKNIHQIW